MYRCPCEKCWERRWLCECEGCTEWRSDEKAQNDELVKTRPRPLAALMPAPNPEAQALLFPKLVESTPPNPTANLYKRSPIKTKRQPPRMAAAAAAAAAQSPTDIVVLPSTTICEDAGSAKKRRDQKRSRDRSANAPDRRSCPSSECKDENAKTAIGHAKRPRLP